MFLPFKTWALFFRICELPWCLWKHSGLVSCFLLHGLEFRIYFLLYWLPPKARGLSLPCYLSHSLGRENRWIHAFPRSIHTKVDITLSQNFNSVYWFHFLCCYPLRYMCILYLLLGYNIHWCFVCNLCNFFSTLVMSLYWQCQVAGFWQ